MNDPSRLDRLRCCHYHPALAPASRAAASAGASEPVVRFSADRGRGMRRHRWLLILSPSLAACLLSGCLRAPLPPDASIAPSDNPTRASQKGKDGLNQLERSPPESQSDYQLCLPPPVKPDGQAAIAPVKAVELRITPPETLPPAQPADPPQPRVEIHAPSPKPDASLVQALRALLDHHSAEEVLEQLKQYDPATREALRVLLGTAAQLEQDGGVPRTTPRDLAALADRLNALTVALRGQAQLTLDNMFFCSHIKNFGQFEPLDQYCFQPGDWVHVYVEVRNFASRREGAWYKTVLKGRLEIYDEHNRATPSFLQADEKRADLSRTPRQDFWVNCRFRVPNCPPGSYTVYVYVEDWTDAPAEAKEVPPSRIARKSLDFRVGGPLASRIADGPPSR
jgi:hypothetical protein